MDILGSFVVYPLVTMRSEKGNQEKTKLHPRNRNRDPYDLGALISVEPQLKRHIQPNKYGGESVDFANPEAVRLLNKALLKHYYGISYWDFPGTNLCPPIPGRADYIHYVADLLSESNGGVVPTGSQLKGLDVGVGASCIYPLLGVTEYGWNFIGSDINKASVVSARKIVNGNPTLREKIECKLQENPKAFFQGILSQSDKIDFSICNPPFHSSLEEAKAGTRRKVQNLSGRRTSTPKLNFSGITEELIYEGGEFVFVRQMILESKNFSKNCFWFSTLISKEANLKGVYQTLEKLEVNEVRTIGMETGNKSSRIVAWSFLRPEEQKEWVGSRWK